MSLTQPVREALRYIGDCRSADTYSYASLPDGQANLYATCYASLVRLYLGEESWITPQTLRFIEGCQDPKTGYYVGPELVGWEPRATSVHNREHLLMHLTCTVLPVLQQLGVPPRYPLIAAHKFCELAYLRDWLTARDMRHAWLEGNNLLFVGQCLVFLRDVERYPQAQLALDSYFEWLDTLVDHSTGLWGTDGQCSPFVAMCGGYHQLLVYYYEDHPVNDKERLVDTVLELQHPDGGFAPEGGGGACEDADAVDILVNMYKQTDYRRVEIRAALRKALRHLRSIQNSDGGFPYGQQKSFIHMGIPATASPPGASNIFPTWFRVHTIGLISQILTDEPEARIGWRFNDACSMGWHRPWDTQAHAVHWWERQLERRVEVAGTVGRWKHRGVRVVRKILGHAR